jgi:hypothetical protein
MKFVNIDAMGKEYRYDSVDRAMDMSYVLPYNWKAIALAVAE